MQRSPSVLLVLAGLIGATSAAAQGVTLSATATTPIHVTTWTYWGGANNYIQPTGPLGASGVVGVAAPLSPAFIEWSSASSPGAEAFALSMNVVGQGGLLQGSHAAFEFVLDVTSSAPRAIELDFERLATSTAPLVAPTISVDIGNDGSVEFPDLPAAGATLTGLAAGPTPLQIAVAVSGVSSLSNVTGGLTSDLRVTARPDNDLVIQKEVDSCLPGVPGFEPPVPVFVDDGVHLHFAPGLLVASTVAAPTWWTPASPLPFATACLLVPQPDILLWLPQGFAHVALPAAVRPAVLHVQAVHIDPVGIVASDGYRVTAN